MSLIKTLWDKLSPKGLTPPQAIEDEEAMLGCMMVNKAAASSAFGVIGSIEFESSPFYRDKHTYIYLAMLSIEETDAIDLITTNSALIRSGKLDAVGGSAYLHELTMKAGNSVNVGQYAKEILSTYAAREGIRIAEETKLKLFEKETEPYELLAEYEAQTSAVLESKHRGSLGFRAVSTITGETIKAMDAAEKLATAGKPTGIPYGLSDLDKLTGGSERGDLVVLAAPPGGGKTSLAAHFAFAPSNAGMPLSVAIFSLEMRASKLLMRMLCIEAGISINKARRGLLTPEDWVSIASAKFSLEARGIYILDNREINESGMRSSLRHLVTKLSRTERPLGRVIVDYLSLPTLPGKLPRTDEIGNLLKNLRNLGGDLDTDMIMLGQFQKEAGRKRKTPRPIVSDLAEGANLERVAQQILLLYRAETFDINFDEAYLLRCGTAVTKGIAEIIVPKNTHGTPGDVIVHFDASQTRFSDWPMVSAEFEPDPQAEILF